MNDAVVEVRRQHWNEHRDAGDVEQAGNLKGTRWGLLKAPEKLTEKQPGALREVESLKWASDMRLVAERRPRWLVHRSLGQYSRRRSDDQRMDLPEAWYVTRPRERLIRPAIAAKSLA